MSLAYNHTESGLDPRALLIPESELRTAPRAPKPPRPSPTLCGRVDSLGLSTNEAGQIPVNVAPVYLTCTWASVSLSVKYKTGLALRVVRHLGGDDDSGTGSCG